MAVVPGGDGVGCRAGGAGCPVMVVCKGPGKDTERPLEDQPEIEFPITQDREGFIKGACCIVCASAKKKGYWREGILLEDTPRAGLSQPEIKRGFPVDRDLPILKRFFNPDGAAYILCG